MSKINQIQSALKELDGGKFQKFADAYLKKKGYEHLNPLGSVTGTDKVRKGTPDTLITLPNGQFIFVEHTTQATNVFSKLQSDINKCLDETKTGVPLSRIDGIILCHTSSLTAGEINLLISKCLENTINLNIFNLEVIAYDLLDKYRGLAQEFLGIEVDSGQIIAPDEFISLYGKNKLATRLNTKFHFRESEITELNSAIEADSLVVVAGKAGVGKTRLALECAAGFKKNHPECQVLCIFNFGGRDLFEDLRIHLSEPGSYLVLVDDANRISKFDYITHILMTQRDDQKIKVLATVRDYAVEKILKASEVLGRIKVITIEPFTGEQIKKLIETEYGIINSLYLDRIASIAQGNPRLALMAAEVAKEKDTLDSINDVSSLYDKYYSSIRQDLNELENSSLLKIAGIVAFFRVIDSKNEDLITLINEAFDVNAEDLWTGIKTLHEMEILDIYEDEVTKVSDQVLATYLFYLAFFKEKVIDFGILLNSFFPQQRSRLIDAINPILNSFDIKSICDYLQPHIDLYWDAKIKENDKSTFLELVRVFWFIKQTEALVFIDEEIKKLPLQTIELSSLNFDEKSDGSDTSTINILVLFKNTNDITFRMALELLCDYLEKSPENLPKVIYALKHNLCFRHTSYLSNYSVQQAVIEVLVERSKNSTLVAQVFLKVAEKYLQTNFDCHEMSDNHTMTMIRFGLGQSDVIDKIRKCMWDRIWELSVSNGLKDEVLELLNNYSVKRLEHQVTKIIENDSFQVLPFLESLSPTNFRDCFVVKKYLNNLYSIGITVDTELTEKFESSEFQLYKLLTQSHIEQRDLKLEYEEYGEFKKNKINEYTINFDFDAYKELITQCIKIQSSIPKDSLEYQFNQNIITLLTSAAEYAPELYSEVIKYYLELGNPLKIQSFLPVKRLVDSCGIEKSFELLTTTEYPNKDHWLFGFFMFLPKDKITDVLLSQLIELYKTSDLVDCPFDWSYLLNYLSIEPKTIIIVTEIILQKAETDARWNVAITGLFYCFDIKKDISQHFEGKNEILKKCYFLYLGTKNHPDYSGNFFNQLLNEDSHFIVEYIDWMFSKQKYLSEYDDERDYKFLWERDDYQKIMRLAATCVFKHETITTDYSYFKVFFNLDKNRGAEPEFCQKQTDFLMNQISEHCNETGYMSFIFNLIICVSAKSRIPFFSKFIELNKRYSSFKELPLIISSRSWSGSLVPYIQADVEYLNDLLQIFTKVAFLKHKQKIEQEIAILRRNIERELKSDFISSD